MHAERLSSSLNSSCSERPAPLFESDRVMIVYRLQPGDFRLCCCCVRWVASSQEGDAGDDVSPRGPCALLQQHCRQYPPERGQSVTKRTEGRGLVQEKEAWTKMGCFPDTRLSGASVGVCRWVCCEVQPGGRPVGAEGRASPALLPSCPAPCPQHACGMWCSNSVVNRQWLLCVSVRMT